MKTLARLAFWAVVLGTAIYLIHDVITPVKNVYNPITVALGGSNA